MNKFKGLFAFFRVSRPSSSMYEDRNMVLCLWGGVLRFSLFFLFLIA